jgi:hypothetical protein
MNGDRKALDMIHVLVGVGFAILAFINGDSLHALFALLFLELCWLGLIIRFEIRKSRGAP